MYKWSGMRQRIHGSTQGGNCSGKANENGNNIIFWPTQKVQRLIHKQPTSWHNMVYTTGACKVKLWQQARAREGSQGYRMQEMFGMYKHICTLSLINYSRMNSELTKQGGMAFTEARCSESAIQSLQRSCALCAMIQSHVPQFGPCGMGGNFGSKG